MARTTLEIMKVSADTTQFTIHNHETFATIRMKFDKDTETVLFFESVEAVNGFIAKLLSTMKVDA